MPITIPEPIAFHFYGNTGMQLQPQRVGICDDSPKRSGENRSLIENPSALRFSTGD
jgi:hypothetical protein